MEREVLRVLEVDLTQPTTKTFLSRYIKAASGWPLVSRWACPALGPTTCKDTALDPLLQDVPLLSARAVAMMYAP